MHALKKEITQVNNLILQFKHLENEEQNKSKASKENKRIIKIKIQGNRQ